jgi:hypothetical protein
MEIEGTTFGTITIDGKTYEHDVIIRLSGEVVKRKKKRTIKAERLADPESGVLYPRLIEVSVRLCRYWRSSSVSSPASSLA